MDLELIRVEQMKVLNKIIKVNQDNVLGKQIADDARKKLTRLISLV